MTNKSEMDLVSRDKKAVWHPFTHIKGSKDPIPAVRGEGAYLFDEKGNAFLDAISSWWVNLHGHSHPHIVKRVQKQVAELEHVIFAGFTHPPGVELAEKILEKVPGKPGKVFYSDNGSTAMEAAVKIALQYWVNAGEDRKRIVAFDTGYHGDTFGAMSVSSRSAFTAPFHPFLFDVSYIGTPVEGKEEEAKDQLAKALEGGDVAAFVFEPLVQGASGMRMFSPDVLDSLLDMCREKGVLTIADEVFTGFGRTGKLFACDYLSHHPDIVGMSKGLSGGTLPLAATTCTQEVQDAFISEDKMKTFFHGHSYTGNPIACAAASASMELLDEPDTLNNIQRIGERHQDFMNEAQSAKGIGKLRTLGTILALEITTAQNTSYFNDLRDRIHGHFLDRGILLRPLGNEIYVVPPYCISNEDLDRIYSEILEFADKYGE